MADADRTWTISKRIGRFAGDRRVIVLLVVGAAFLFGRAWLAENPQHDPWAPLDLRDPPGWTTENKLVALRDDPDACRAVLERSDVTFTALEPAGEGPCRREDRTVLGDLPLSPAPPPTTCPVGIAMELWMRDVVQPAAQERYGSAVAEVEHFGSFSCRRLYGRGSGPWSEHATGNAIDIAAFVLDDGTRISVLGDWEGEDNGAAFLREARDGACGLFGTVLSPEYNEAHRDHFHFDMAGRSFGVCR
ncbi:extensin family protein [Qipengyuania sp. JC766]|uniref:extensin-like domain-containing protein n=1 Tax=Qipengyuania sp. JC766 TaxID=3232139 RepID=UPI00345AFE31